MPEEIEVESSETENSDWYLAEDPSSLSDEQLRAVGDRYGLTLSEMKSIAKSMSKARKELDPREITR